MSSLSASAAQQFHVKDFVMSYSLSLIIIANILPSLHLTWPLLKLYIFRFISAVCNRTLYGEINKTYEIEVPKPGDVPFVCTLNFTALGGEHGDIIQVSS